MGNDVVIRVTAKNAVKEGFDLSKRDVKKFSEESAEIFMLHFGTKIRRLGTQIAPQLSLAGKDMGKNLSETISETLTRNVTQKLRTEFKSSTETIGDDMGKTMGEHFSDKFNDEVERKTQTIYQRIRQRFKTSIDESTSSSHSGGHNGKLGDSGEDVSSKTASRFRALGEKLGGFFTDGMGSKIGEFFSGDVISLIVKGLAVGALAAALAPVLGAAVTAAVGLAFGGGVLAAGVVAALKDPRIQGATADLKKKIGDAFSKFGEPFRSPVANFLEKLAGFIDKLSPKLQQIGKIFAPVLDQLGTGFIGLLQNAMPGILDMVKASAPLFETLAKHLPKIGDALGNFFKTISEQGDDANVFFNDLLTFVEKFIIGLGKVIAFLTSMYSVVSGFVRATIGMFKSLGNAIGDVFSTLKSYVLRFVLYALTWIGRFAAGAAEAFSWIPGIGSKLKGAERRFNEFRHRVQNELNGIRDKTVRIHIVTTGAAVLQAALGAARMLRAMGNAHGGIQGAASGGVRSNLTWVGEQGPELVSLPAGSTVHTAGDSQRMMRNAGGQGGGGTAVVRLVADHATERSLIGVLFSLLRTEIAAQGGNVQVVLGRSR